ncbi:MAG: futalosine hydrolase [Jatrophihabitantaceae bacterium]
MNRLLVVTAVEAERAAITAGLPDCATSGGLTAVEVAQSGRIEVVVGGVGPATAAAATSAALATARFQLVLSAGIGGGFTPLEPGAVAVASRIVFADLGAETAEGFVPISTLGFGPDCYDVDPKLAIELADLTGGHLGTILTVATVTGSSRRAAQLSERFPDAIAEGMEGAGVAAAAVHHGVAFAEIRAVSNAVGPRERDAWQVPQALAALGRALANVANGWAS